jgi:hypothetical protein
MRACTQCGLSIGDAATFCAVCGARADAMASTEQAPASEAPAAPAAPTADTLVPGEGEGRPRGAGSAPSRRRSEAALPMVDAGRLEKMDPARSAALYREAILVLLEAAADPLDHEDTRRDLLQIFDRLSVVLKREGLPAEALEEIDCAASLGLLDCQDHGIKGHLDALRKRRESLRRTLDGHPPAAS